MSPSKLHFWSRGGAFGMGGSLQRLNTVPLSRPTSHLRYLSRHCEAVRYVVTPLTVVGQGVLVKPIEAGEVLATKLSAVAPISAPLTAPTPSRSVPLRLGRTEKSECTAPSALVAGWTV